MGGVGLRYRVRHLLGVVIIIVGSGVAAWAQDDPSSDAAFAASLKGVGRPPVVHHKPWKTVVKVGVAHYFKGHTITVGKPQKAALGTLIRRVELAPLRNRQWGSAKFFEMGGASTALSGQFSRSRKAYFGVFPDGAREPTFVAIGDLIDGDAGILVNKVEYRMSLAAKVWDRLASRIRVLEAKSGQAQETTMRNIFVGVFKNGVPVEAGGKALRMFYGQDVDDRGAVPLAGKEESLCFLMEDGSDYKTFLIPLEYVPTDGSAGEFTLRPGMTITLRLIAGKLEIF